MKLTNDKARDLLLYAVLLVLLFAAWLLSCQPVYHSPKGQAVDTVIAAPADKNQLQ